MDFFDPPGCTFFHRESVLLVHRCIHRWTFGVLFVLAARKVHRSRVEKYTGDLGYFPPILLPTHGYFHYCTLGNPELLAVIRASALIIVTAKTKNEKRKGIGKIEKVWHLFRASVHAGT